MTNSLKYQPQNDYLDAMEKFGAMPARSWPPSGMLPNLDVVLQERHYREPFKKLRSPRGRLLGRAKSGLLHCRNFADLDLARGEVLTQKLSNGRHRPRPHKQISTCIRDPYGRAANAISGWTCPA
jgi:hypothetical protein